MIDLPVSRCCGWMSAAAVAFAMGLVGCGSGNPSTAVVHGKVTFNGQPVTGGGLTFAPIAEGAAEPGKPASGTIGSDGSFTLNTYGEGDGAVIGKHRVSYSPPPPPGLDEATSGDGAAHAAPAAPSPFAGLAPKEAQVDVKEGDNEINIELVK